MNAPILWTVEQTIHYYYDGPKAKVITNGGERWLPARPLALASFAYRLKLAWMVFTGRADALTWPHLEPRPSVLSEVEPTPSKPKD